MAVNKKQSKALIRDGFHAEIVFRHPDHPDQSATVIGVIDTGASETVVTSSVCKRLGLIQTGTGKYVGASGPVDAAKFAVLFELPGIGVGSVAEIMGLSPENFGGNVEALIGRDVLSMCKMMWDGPAGTVTIKATMNKIKRGKRPKHH